MAVQHINPAAAIAPRVIWHRHPEQAFSDNGNIYERVGVCGDYTNALSFCWAYSYMHWISK